ncbi:MAG: hypothetical protein ATN36_06545 [Epulopiscium sp. Nele67-Bin005]|nr:MAG: hypothetical protein ATN36_06545 [Epulopiscium sp. Nele67-Bin005]
MTTFNIDINLKSTDISLEHLNFNERLKYLLFVRGMTEAELAQKSHISRSTIQRFKNNNKQLSIETRLKFSEILDVDKSMFCGEYELFLISNFSDEIKNFRLKNSLTQLEFGEILEVNRKTVRYWEKGYCVPNEENYLKLKEQGL